MEDADFDRVAFYDPAYQTGWVHDPEGVARLLAERHGFIVLEARRLAAWMKAVTARDPSNTVCVLLQGYFPDTIAERKSKSCAARRYLDAGGRLVSVGDVPFYQIGDARGGRKTWGNEAHATVLGVEHIWGDHGASEVTEAGRQWGLVLPDTGVRCSKVAEVTALRTVKPHHWPEPGASTWHKVYNPKHPLQGFLRYRGGSFDARHWNAQVNELARMALRGFEEAFIAPDSWRDDAQSGAPRVVFSDARYASAGSENAQASAAKLASDHGFALRDAEGLAAWMRAQVAAGAAGSVAVLLHGVAPETVYDDVSPRCLARRYMDAGGRLVWAGDCPFFYRGLPDGQYGFRNDEGTHEAVLDIPTRSEGELSLPSYLRDLGAGSHLMNYAAEVPGSGFLRFRVGRFHPEQASELAAAALKDLPPRAVASRPLVVEADGERTGGGGFVVDRERALKKLMKFMLPSPELFLLPLARVAASSGAQRFSLERAGRDLVVRFDGEPLPPEAIHDPFAAVTSESGDPRLRAWGLAVLTALRANPREVYISSAGGKLNSSATVRSVKEVVGGTGGAADGGTEFHIVRPFVAFPPIDELRDSLAARAPGFAEQLAERGARPRGAPAEFSFDDGTVSGCIRVPTGRRATSNLLVCVQGVGAATVSFVLHGAAAVDGWVNDDRLGLNASLNGVVRDERLERLRGVAAEKLPRLIRIAAAKSQDRSSGRAARLARPGMAALWRRELAGTPEGRLAEAWGAVARGAVPDAVEEELRDEARLLVWLRVTAGMLLSSLDGDQKDTMRAALWGAPLFTAVDGTPLSLETLERYRRRDGRVLVAPELGDAPDDARPVVWAAPGREVDALRHWFGDDVQAAGNVRSRGDGGPLEDAGLSDFLVRLPIDGGEIGLRVRPDRPGLRVHGLKDGRPDSFYVHACRQRVDAAVEGAADARAAAIAAGAFDRLYRLLAEKVSCPVAPGLVSRFMRAWRGRPEARLLEREAAALSHLRDYLAASVSVNGPDWPRSVPLYESSEGWLSHDGLGKSLARDGVLLWVDAGNAPYLHGLDLGTAFGRGEGDARMPEMFRGLERRPLDRVNTVAWLKSPPRPVCAHQAPLGCLVEGMDQGTPVHMAVSEKGEILLYPVPDGKVRSVTVEGLGRMAYDAALAIAVRAPQCLAPGNHPWRGFVMQVAARYLAPWPGEPSNGALRALLFGHLTFRARWGSVDMAAVVRVFTRTNPVIYVPPEGAVDGVNHIFTDAELTMFKDLWPKTFDNLMLPAEFERYHKALSLEGGDAKPETQARAMAAAKLRAPAAVVRGEIITDPEAGARKLLKDLSARSGSWAGGARVDDFGKGKPRVDASSLTASSKAAYLASLAHTAVNRARSLVTDANDTSFQAALAAWAAEEDV